MTTSLENGALSLDPNETRSYLAPDPDVPAPEVPHVSLMQIFRRFGLVVAVVILMLGAAAVLVANTRRGSQADNRTTIINQYETQQIPLESLVTEVEDGISLATSNVVINGALKLNQGVVISPSVQPNAPTAGQLYFDQNTNQLAYYNGAAFIPLTASAAVVQSVGGSSGQITLGGGLTVVNNQLSFDPSTLPASVTSIADQSGAISLGPGLVMNGSALASSGVLDILAGANITVSDDGSGVYTITNTGAGTGTVTSGGGTNGVVALFTASQNIEDSVISQSGTTVTVAGTLNLSNALTVANGGTGTTTLANNGVVVGQGAAAVTTVTAGGPGLCLLSTAGAPTFAACPSASGAPDNAEYIVRTLNGTLTNERAIAAGSNLSLTDGGANGNLTIATIANPSFGTSVTTPQLASASALTLSSGATTISLDAVTTIELQDSTNITGNLDVSGTFTAATSNAFTINSSGAITAATGITSSGTITFSGLNCTGNANGGALTANGSGQIVCSDDDGGSGSAITGSGTAGTIPVFNGAQTITNSIITQTATTIDIAGDLTLDTALTVANGGTGATSFTANGVLFGNGGGALQVTAAGTSGQVLVANGSGTPVFVSFSGDVTVAANGATTVQANSVALGTDTTGSYVANLGSLTGLSTTGNSGEGSTPTLSVDYGALVNTAVQGNVTLTCASGSGNLSGGGNTITLGSGGSCNTISIVNNPSFATSVTTPILQSSGALTISSGATTVAIDATTTIELQDSTNVTGSLDVSAGLNAGNTDAFQVNASGAITAATGITSSGTVIFSGLNCTGNANGGAITTNGSGQLVCSDDDGGAGGAISGSGTNGTIPVFNGAQTITDSIITQTGTTINIAGDLTLTTDLTVANGGTGASSFTSNGVLYGNGAGALQVTAAGTSGQVLVANGSGVPTFVSFSGDVTVAANGATTIQANSVALGADTTGDYIANLGSLTGLNTSGNSGEGSTPTLSVAYGSIANTSVQGNITLTCPSGTGNLTGGGTSITLGTGGSCANLNTVNNPSFTTSVTSPQFILTGAGSNGTIVVANLGQPTTFTLPDPVGASATICISTGNCAAAGAAGGDLTGTYPNPTIASLQGSDLTIAGPAAGHVLVYNGTNSAWENVAVSGDINISETGGTTIQANSVALTTDTTGNYVASVSAGNGISVGGSAGEGWTPSVAVLYGSSANTAVQGNTSITVSPGTNLTGGGSITLGAGGSVTLNVANSPTFSGTLAVQGASVTVGGAAQQGSVILEDGDGEAGTLRTADLSQPTTFILPDAGGPTATICLTTGNCAGTGGGITGSGTTDRVSKFTGTGTIGDSSVSDDGTTVTINGTANLVVQGGTGTFGTNSQAGTIVLSDGSNDSVSIAVSALATERTYTLPDVGGDADFCLSTGNCIGGGGGGAPNDAAYLLASLNGTLSNDRALNAGTNISFTDGGANGNFTVATVNNPSFSTSVTTPTLQSSGALTISSGATTVAINATTTIELQDSTNVTGSLDVSVALNVGTSDAFTVNSSGAITAATGITSSGTITFSGLNCTGNANGGALTANGSGQIVCSDDDGAAGGSITGSGTSGTIPVFNGAQTITDSIVTQSGTTVNIAGDLTLSTDLTVANGGTGASSFTSNGVLYGNGSGTLQVTAAGTSGQVLVANGSGVPTFVSFSGDVTVAANGAATIQANSVALGTDTTGDYVTNLGTLTGLTTSGNSGEGSTPTLSVSYGALANTAVQGNTSLVCPSGTGNLTGGGNSITLGSGGTCSSLSTVNNPAFTTSVTTPQVIFTGAGSNGTLQVANLAAPRTYTLPVVTGNVDICVSSGNCAAAGTAGGDLTGSYPNPTIASLQGTTLDITTPTAGHVLVYNGTNSAWENVAVSGDITFAEDGTAAIQANAVALTTDTTGNYVLGVSAGNGISVGGSAGEGWTPSVAVLYGSTANTAVQGNTSITVSPGTNLTGGGSITLGAGGTVTLNVANSPTFSGTLTVQGATVTIGTTSVQGGLVLHDGAGETGTLQVDALGQASTYTLPDPGVGGAADICLSTGNCVGSGGGAPNNAAYLVASLNGTLSDERLLNAGTNISLADGGANGNFTVATVNNPTFSASVTTPSLQSSAALNISNTSGTIAINSATTIELQDNTNVSGNLDVTGTLTLGTALAVAEGGTGAATFTANGVIYGNTTGALQVTAAGTGGQVLIANSSGVPTFVSFSGDLTVSNTGVTAIQANSVALGTDTTGDYVANLGTLTGLTTSGNSGEGSTPTLSVTYGSGANTAVQGNTSITVSPGTNLTGGGSITLGSGGSVTLNVANSPTFSGTLIVQGASTTIGTALQQGSLILHDGDGDTATISVGSALGDDTVLAIPTGVSTSDTFCLQTLANCTGGGVSGSGTANRVAKFTGASTVGDSSISDNGTAVSLASGVTFGVLGAASFQNAANSTSAFNIVNASAANLFTVDTTNSRVGINLGGTSTPTLATGVTGMELRGSLRFSTTSGILDQFAGQTGDVGARINMPFFAYSGSEQGIAVGVQDTSNVTARGITVFDRRTGVHQASIGVMSPSEAHIAGLSWDGSNTTVNLKTSSATGIAISPNSTAAATFTSSSVALQQATTVSANFIVTNAGNIAFERASDISTTGTLNNQAITGGSVRFTGASAQTLTGIAGGVNGRILSIINAAGQALTINNNDTVNSSATNVIITGTGANVTLATGASITLIYDSGANVWRVLGGVAGGSGTCSTCADTALSNLSSVDINVPLNSTSGDLNLTTTTTGNIVLNSVGTIALQDATDITGALGVSGDITVTQSTPSLFLTDSDSSSDDYSFNVNASALTVVNDTDSRTELSFAGNGSIDIGDNTATKTIHIGGVDSSAADTISIGTNNSAADVITVGNNNPSTTLALTGGDDWSINTSGAMAVNYVGTASADVLNVSALGLTTGSALDITTRNTTGANTSWSANKLTVYNFQATTGVSGANQIAGLDVQFLQETSAAGNNETVANFVVAASGATTGDTTVASILNLANNDTATGNQTTVTDAIRITGTNVTNGINLSGTFGGNLIESTNFDVANSGLVTLSGASAGMVGANAATATTGTTEATARTNVTTVTLTAAGSFANNDIIFINNAGQDYYTRIVSGGGTTTLTVSPAVSYDVSASVTKYNIQNIGATATDYTTTSNRFFQGYFLGGVVAGAGTTTLSDNRLHSTGQMNFNSSSFLLQNTADSTAAMQVQTNGGTNVLSVNTTGQQVRIGSTSLGDNATTAQLHVGGRLPASTLATLTLSGAGPNATDVQGRYLYVAGWTDNTLRIIDISNPASPVQVGSASTGSDPMSVSVSGNYAYVFNFTGETMQIFNISNPASPTLVSTMTPVTVHTGVSLGLGYGIVHGRYAYIAAQGSLFVVDVSNPAAPVQVASLNTSSLNGLFVQGKYLYAMDTGLDELVAIDISDPTSPVVRDNVALASGVDHVYVQGRYAYATGGNNFYVIDVSNPNNLTITATLSAGASSNPTDVYVQGRYAYTVDHGTGNIHMYDISTPASPVSLGTVAAGSTNGLYGLNVVGRYLYTSNFVDNNIRIYDLGGTYLQQVEAGGLETGTLNVNSSAVFAGDASIQGGLRVGQSLQVEGDFGNTMFQAPNTASSEIYSDLFTVDTGSPGSGWTFTANGGSFSTGADPGHFRLTAPSGSAHDCYNAGTMTCVRMMRDIVDEDAQYSVEVDTVTWGGDNGYYGMLIRQDDNNLLRFAIIRTPTGVYSAHIYRAQAGAVTETGTSTITPGATNLLRITRTGNQYVFEYSVNGGTTWNLVGGSMSTATVNAPWLSPTEVGFMVGNFSTNPQVQASFDNFTVTRKNRVTARSGINIKTATDDVHAFQIQNSAGTTVANIDTTTGAATFKSGTNTSSAFEVQNAAGSSLVNVDSKDANITLLGLTTGETSTWSSDTALSQARYGGGAVTANGYVYMVGGVNASHTSQSTVYYAKLNTDGTIGAWNTTTSFSSFGNRSRIAPVVANGYMYIVGGYDGTTTYDTTLYAKINSNGTLGTWQSTSVLPAQRRTGQSVVANGYIYYMGGQNAAGGASTFTTVYSAKLNADGTVGAWTTLGSTPLPDERFFAGNGTYANGYIYVIGGQDSSNAHQTTVYYARANADGTIDAWQTDSGSPLPAARSEITTAVANGHIYVLTGGDSGGFVDTVYYAPLTSGGGVGTWQLAANDMGASVGSASSIAANGHLYVLGGYTGSNVVSTVYRASTSRVKVGGSLDLVGLQGQALADPGDASNGSAGGALTAGNGTFVGALQVQGGATFAQGVSINGVLVANDSALFKTATNSTTGFQIQNSSGTALLVGDTTNLALKVGGGNVSPDTAPALFVLDHKNSTGDPASTVAGSMYYNATDGRFRCYEAAWRNCLSSSETVSGGNALSSGNTSAGTYLYMPSAPNVNFTKRYASTKLLVTAHTTMFTGTAGTVVSLAIRVGGADYECGRFFFNTANEHTQISCSIAISGLGAGADAAGVRWRVAAGAGPLNVDTNDWATVVVQETD